MADDLAARYETATFQSATGEQLAYRLLRPREEKLDQSYPLVLFLHGAGERGSDNHAQLKHVALSLATDEMQERHPCYVIATQCPNGLQWVDTPWTADSHHMAESPTAPLQQLFDLLQHLDNLRINPQRLYVIGLSMGGFGTWEMLQRRPELFAAAVPICGGGDTDLASRLTSTPIWAFHGAADSVVKPKRSRDMVEAIRAAGGHPIYTEYEGVGHDSWARTAENRLVWDWMFAQSRAQGR